MNYTTLTPTQIKETENALSEVVAAAHLLASEPMKKHTTFRVGGEAALFAAPDEKELPEVLRILSAHGIRPLVIGNGSNLLVSDEGIDGVVIKLGDELSAITVDEEGGTITAQAGARLGAVARKAAEASLAGMEFASGIPGSIGGAVMMNAGAYGGEMKDIITAVNYIPAGNLPAASGNAGNRAENTEHRGENTECRAESTTITGADKTAEQAVFTIKPDDDTFSYRHSIFMEMDTVITSVVLQLERGDPEAISAKMKELNARRIEKQPLEYPSAGSTFKRPEGYFAGKLIEDAGLRGYRVGGAAVSQKHCGFVVNDRNATAQDVYDVIRHVQREVIMQFGVTLEPEVRLIGTFRE